MSKLPDDLPAAPLRQARRCEGSLPNASARRLPFPLAVALYATLAELRLEVARRSAEHPNDLPELPRLPRW